MSRAFWLLIPFALATGCARDAVKPAVPQIVRVEVPVYVSVPDELTQPCPIAEPTSLGVAEAVKIANARKVALQNCNADKAAIRSLALPPAK